MRRLASGIVTIMVLGSIACQDTALAPDLSPDDITSARKKPAPEPPPDDGGGTSVSPMIVFNESTPRDGFVFYFMDTDGNRGEALVDGDPMEGVSARWAPDGTRFVYTREVTFKKAPSELRLMVASLDPGTDTWSVARVPVSSTRTGYPAWSPHDWIVYNVAGDLWTVRPDGSGETQLTSDGDIADNTVWSRDGSKVLAHVHDGTGWRMRLYSVDCSSGTCEQDAAPTEILLPDLGLDPLDDLAPVDWAHTQDKVLCALGTSAGWDMAILDLTDPSSPTLENLTDSPEAGESQGAWSPDDTQIVHDRWTFDRAPMQLVIRDLATGTVSVSVEADVSRFGVDWNPDPTPGT